MKTAKANTHLCSSISTPDWTKQLNKHCYGNTGGLAYPSLSAAEAACGANSKCSGVYDSSCDSSGSFYQCDSSSLQTSSSSCVYTKPLAGPSSSRRRATETGAQVSLQVSWTVDAATTAQAQSLVAAGQKAIGIPAMGRRQLQQAGTCVVGKNKGPLLATATAKFSTPINLFASPLPSGTRQAASASGILLPDGYRNDFTGEVGFEIAVHQGFSVTFLGRATAFTKLKEAETVSVWDVRTNKKMTSIVVGPSSIVQNGYARVALPRPLLLIAGRSYAFSQSVSDGMTDTWFTGDTSKLKSNATITNKAIQESLCSITKGVFVGFGSGAYSNGFGVGAYPANTDSNIHIGPTFFIH